MINLEIIKAFLAYNSLKQSLGYANLPLMEKTIHVDGIGLYEVGTKNGFLYVKRFIYGLGMLTIRRIELNDCVGVNRYYLHFDYTDPLAFEKTRPFKPTKQMAVIELDFDSMQYRYKNNPVSVGDIKCSIACKSPSNIKHILIF